MLFLGYKHGLEEAEIVVNNILPSYIVFTGFPEIHIVIGNYFIMCFLFRRILTVPLTLLSLGHNTWQPTLEDDSVNLVHGFRGCSPWSTGYIKNIMAEGHAGEK